MLAASQYDTLNIIRRLATTNTPQDRLAYQLLLRYTKKAACISGAGLLHAATGAADASAFLELAERVALGEDRWAQSSASVTTAAEQVSLQQRYVNMLRSMYGDQGIPPECIQQLAHSGIYIKDQGSNNGLG